MQTSGCLTKQIIEWPFLAGKRPLTLTGQGQSDFGLLGHFECVVYLDPQVTHCTFKFGMA
jgi:hypothetical protein